LAQIDYYFSTISPFTYLAGQRLEAIAAKHGAGVSYKPIDILALFSRTGGMAPKDRHESRKTYRLQELRRPSSYAIIAAQAAKASGGGGDLGGLVHGFTRACWAEERDIAQDDVVQDLLGRYGFDPGLSFSGMLLGAETFAANLEDAAGRGVFGAPFYITGDDERFWGQDRLEDLDLHLAGKL
jgi:2-hydroxychromene-2-carboxylate isomerase